VYFEVDAKEKKLWIWIHISEYPKIPDFVIFVVFIIKRISHCGFACL
jgi:hypothetical protein